MASRSRRLVRWRFNASSARPKRQLLAERQVGGARKGFGEVQGRRKDAGLENRGAPARFDEEELFVEGDLMLDADPAVEIDQVDAAAQQDVLAVVDGFGLLVGVRDFVGGRASAEERTAFEQVHLEPGIAQGSGGSQTREASTDDDGGRRGIRRLGADGWNPGAVTATAAIGQLDGQPQHDEGE